MESKPGTYILVLKCRRTLNITIGRWGKMAIQPGYYLYVGSAFGPGGVKARVLKHFRRTRSKHWHIDYLCHFVRFLGAWFSYSDDRLEHQWAALLSDMSDMSPIVGFGCSDCRCNAHLFYTAAPPDIHLFTQMADCRIDRWICQPD